MMADIQKDAEDSSDDKPYVLSDKEQAVLENLTGGNWKKYGRVAMAALGAVPWVGSLISATATLSSENDAEKTNKLLILWVQEHEQQLRELVSTLQEMCARFESFGERIEERVQSPEYITLVRKTFKQWDAAETAEKKDLLKKLIINASGLSLAEDDLIRLFLDWIEKYHEFHFAVIREIFKNPGITRAGIWANLRGEVPREDSADADLFRLLIRDLSTGGVIRQARETDYAGNFVKRERQTGTKGQGHGRDTMESSFEDTKPYELTQLGREFVHYLMSDLVQQIEA